MEIVAGSALEALIRLTREWRVNILTHVRLVRIHWYIMFRKTLKRHPGVLTSELANDGMSSVFEECSFSASLNPSFDTSTRRSSAVEVGSSITASFRSQHKTNTREPLFLQSLSTFYRVRPLRSNNWLLWNFH